MIRKTLPKKPTVASHSDQQNLTLIFVVSILFYPTDKDWASYSKSNSMHTHAMHTQEMHINDACVCVYKYTYAYTSICVCQCARARQCVSVCVFIYTGIMLNITFKHVTCIHWMYSSRNMKIHTLKVSWWHRRITMSHCQHLDRVWNKLSCGMSVGSIIWQVSFSEYHVFYTALF